MNKRTALAALAVTALALAGCGNSNQKSLSEPVSNHYLTGQIVFMEPDGFRNVAFGCNGTVGVYVTSRGVYNASGSNITALPSGIAVIPADPNCK